MSRRIAFILVAVATVAAGCSHNPERSPSASTPTSPTALNGAVSVMSRTTGLDIGATIGPLGVAMPSRVDAMAFRSALDPKYASTLGRAATNGTYVDIEGDAVWIMEYIRYRVSGCDHGTAVQRVMAEIDGNPAGPDCGLTPEGAVAYPSRADDLAFRRGLDDKYLQLGHSLLFGPVDIEGIVIWIQEYLRYRTSGCNHATAQQKVFDQIDGKPAPQDCYVPPVCQYYFASTNFVQLNPAAGSYTHDIVKYSGFSDCTWTAVSENSFITLTGDVTGGDRGQIRYSVAENLGAGRTGRIRLNFTGGGSTVLEIYQKDRTFQVSIQMFDYKESVFATNTCLIKNFGGNPTTCTLIATAQLNETTTRYKWTATWGYYNGVTRTSVQDNASNTFVISEQCNALATNGGDVVDLVVTLTAFDSLGNQQTVVTGQGLQPAMFLKIFPCS